MVKTRIFPILLLLCLVMIIPSAHGAAAIGVIGGADGPTAVFLASSPNDAPEDDALADDAPEDENEDADGAAVQEPAGDAEPTLLPDASPSPTPIPTPAPVVNGQFQFKVTLGYDGLVGLMRTMPVTVEITNNGAGIDGATLGMNVYTDTTRYERYDIPFSLAQGATKSFDFTIKPKTKQDYYGIEIISNGKIIAEERATPSRLVSPETVLVGLLADNPQPLTYMNIDPISSPTLRNENWTTVVLSAANFPTTYDGMRSLSILMIDGIDVRTLSDAQRSALISWMQSGGIVILGGGTQAGINYPYFAPWTGLEAGSLEQVPDFSQALTSFAELSSTPVNQPFYRNQATGSDATLLLDDEERPLLFMHSIGNGVIFTATFDLSTKPMATWAGARGLWQRIILAGAPSTYMTEIDRRESYGYNRYYYSAQNILQQMQIDNTDDSFWGLVILLAYLLVVGFGSYFVLKRLDKREWMWLTVPICVILATGGLLLMAQRMTLNDPIAVSLTHVQASSGSEEKIVADTYIGVASATTDELLVSSDVPLAPFSDGGYYDSYDNGITPVYRPLNLLQRYVQGENPAIGYPRDAAWTVHILKSEIDASPLKGVDAAIWMEADGVHGRIENGSEQPLDDGFIITPFGYALIDPLLPGQSATFHLKLIDNSAEWLNRYGEMPADVMIFTHNASANYNYVDMYSFTSSAARTYGKVKEIENTYPLMSMLNMCTETWNTYLNPATFHYVAFNRSYGQVPVAIDGQDVTRTAHTTVLDIAMAYEPIGPTGEVFYPAGMLMPELVSGRVSNSASGQLTYNAYLSLTEPVELIFRLPSEGKLIIDSMSLTGDYYDPMPTLWLYHNTLEEWVSQSSPFVAFDAAGWAPYLDEENALRVRYTAHSGSGQYAEMQLPRLSMKGRVE